MDILKKTLNGLGIFLSVILSFILVVILAFTPTVMSLFSALKVETVTDMLPGIISSVSDEMFSSEANNSSPSPNSGAIAGSDIFEDMLGDDVSEFADSDLISELMDTKLVKDVLQIYAEDFTNAIADNGTQSQFNADKIREITYYNIDEVIDVVKRNVPADADIDYAELKAYILSFVDENADDIAKELPEPDEIVKEITDSTPELETVLQIIANRNQIKTGIVAVIIILCVLIFICRIPKLRGLKSIGKNLIAASPTNIILGIIMLFVPSLAVNLVPDIPTEIADAIIKPLFSGLGTGILVRTAIMLASGIALIVVYNLAIKPKFKSDEIPLAPPTAQMAPVAPPMQGKAFQGAPTVPQSAINSPAAAPVTSTAAPVTQPAATSAPTAAAEKPDNKQ